MKEKIYRNTMACLLTLPYALSYGQNVGVGTDTPTEKLEIVGNLKADTLKPNAIILTPNAGPGKILTSDDLGNATWENSSYAPPPEENIGYGVWGDCATNGNITEYNPVADMFGDVNDKFGFSVAISGDFAIIGAKDDDETSADEGSASIFQYNGSGWQFMEKLIDVESAPGDNFGVSVAISGNYAIVGAYSDDATYSDQGSVSIFQFNGNNWELMEKIIDAEGEQYGEFGYSVSISGDFAIVGSYGDDGTFIDQGSASIYHYNGTNWELIEKITDPSGASYDYFGSSVSISGEYLIVGAYGDDFNLNNQGSASIYHYNGTNWDLMEKIFDSNGYENDFFGWSVSISGIYAIAGAIYRNLGGFYDAGMALIYRFNGTNWVEMERMTNDNFATSDYFGCSVTISDHYAIVGAYGVNDGATIDIGAATIYQRMGLGWQKLQYVQDPGSDWEDFFGYAVALDAVTNRFLIGSKGYANNSGKALFGKIR